MKFYLDEDQSPSTARTARQRHDLDITSSHELGRDGATDEEQLLYAGRTGRCIVTRNGDDFIALTDAFEAEQLPHAGVLILPQSIGNDEFARIARAMAWYHEQYPDGVPSYFVSYLRDPVDP